MIKIKIAFVSCCIFLVAVNMSGQINEHIDIVLETSNIYLESGNNHSEELLETSNNTQAKKRKAVANSKDLRVSLAERLNKKNFVKKTPKLEKKENITNPKKEPTEVLYVSKNQYIRQVDNYFVETENSEENMLIIDSIFPLIDIEDKETIFDLNFGSTPQLNIAPDFISKKIKRGYRNCTHYALGLIKNINENDYILVRMINYISDNEDEYICEDYVIAVKNGRFASAFLPIAFKSSSTQIKKFKSFYFENDGTIMVMSTDNLSKRNAADIPLQIKNTNSYVLDAKTAEFKLIHQKSDTLLNPHSFKQFKSLFPDLKINQSISEHKNILLADNEFTHKCFVYPEQKAYVVGKLHDQNNTDFFIIKVVVDEKFSPKFKDKSEMNYVLVYDHGELVNCSVLDNNVVEAQKITKSKSYFDEDMNIVSNNSITNYSSSDGKDFNLPVNINYTYKRTFFVNHFVDGEFENIVFTSPYFNFSRIEKSSVGEKYPTKQHTWKLYQTSLDKKSNTYNTLEFYLVNSKMNQYCVQFLTKEINSTTGKEEIIDETCICNEKDNPKEYLVKPSSRWTKNADMHSILIKTNKSDILVNKNGTFTYF